MYKVNSKNCKVCDGINCNQAAFNQSCYQCYGNCNEITDAHAKNIRVGNGYGERCLVGIVNGGHVFRDCDKSSRYTFQNENYELCTGNQCNNQIFPRDRLFCYQCDYFDCDFSKTNSQVPKVCEKYSSNEECHTYIDKTGTTCYLNFTSNASNSPN